MNRLIFWVLYIVSIIFVLSGAVNDGISKYFMAIPFMVIMLWISKFKFRKNILFYFSIFLIIFSIIINHTQTKNPILYPIIAGGTIEILKDGYCMKFIDGSSGFYSEEEKNFSCTGCGPVESPILKKGEIYSVTGIEIEHPEFGTDIHLITDACYFSEYNYNAGRENIKISRNAQSVWAKNLGMLMAWPVIPFNVYTHYKYSTSGA